MSGSAKTEASPRRFFDFVWGLDGKRPGSVFLGTGDTIQEEAIRFHTSTSLGYPARQMEKVWWEKDPRGRDQCHVRVSFFGLTGITSPLPQSYLRDMADDEDEGNGPIVAGFLDIFNHRFVSLYYRSWLKYRGHMCLDGQSKGGVAALLLALGGLDTELSQDSGSRSNPNALLPFVASLAGRVKSPTCAESSLSDLLGVPVEVRPYDLRQVPVPVGQRLRLGVSACSLGSQDPPVLGEFVPDYMGRCEVRIGPMSRDQLDQLGPDGELRRAVHRVLSASLPATLEYRLTLLLDENTVRDWPLGDGRAPQLGVDMWLGKPQSRDCELPLSVQNTLAAPQLSSTPRQSMANSPSQSMAVDSI